MKGHKFSALLFLAGADARKHFSRVKEQTSGISAFIRMPLRKSRILFGRGSNITFFMVLFSFCMLPEGIPVYKHKQDVCLKARKSRNFLFFKDFQLVTKTENIFLIFGTVSNSVACRKNVAATLRDILKGLRLSHITWLQPVF